MAKSEQKAKKQNSLVVWIIVAIVFAIVFCYGFSVLYFYQISPNDVSAKLSVWPFLSDNDIGNMYLDTMVEISVKNEEDVEQASVLGVNVREDGYVIAEFQNLSDCDENSKITIRSSLGRVFNGKILFADKNYNLAILKCESFDKNVGVRLPFVKIAKLSAFDSTVMSMSSLEGKVNFGMVTDVTPTAIPFTKKINNETFVDFVIENGVVVEFSQAVSGPVFNRRAGILGFGNSMYLNGEYAGTYLVPAGSLSTLVGKVARAYQKAQPFSNGIAESLVGFDKIELHQFKSRSNETSNAEEFYFNGEKVKYPELTEAYDASALEGFYLFDAFSHNEVSIPKDCVVTKIATKNKSVVVKNRVDLFDFVYGLNENENVEIFYQSVANLGQEQSVQTKV